MSYLGIARGDKITSTIVFRGSLGTAATVAWSVAPIKSATGFVEGRILDVGDISWGMPETIGGAPERVSASMKLANHDNAISYLLRGTSSASPATEYLGDGVLNLTGKFYHAVKDPSTNVWVEQAISPTLACTGAPTYDGFEVTIPLMSADDKILGQSKYAVTVRQIVESGHGSVNGTRVDRGGTSSAYTQAQFDAHVRYFKKSLDAKVPYAYGHVEIPMIPVSDGDADSWCKFVCFATRNDPTSYIGSFADWRIHSGKYGGGFAAGDAWFLGAGFPADKARQAIHAIPRLITLDDGTTAEIYVIWFTTQPIETSNRGGRADVMQEKHYLIPTENWLGFASLRGRPAGVIQSVIADHSQTGIGACDSTSFTRTYLEITGANYVGILYYADTKISDAIAPILEAFGISAWIGLDDTLRLNAAWGQADKDQVDAGTPYHITHAEILDGWKEMVPNQPGGRGTPSTRIRARWSPRQKEFYTVDELIEVLPGTTIVPVAEIIEDEIDASAIFPPEARTALGITSARRSFVSRRVEFVAPAWVATQDKGTIFLVSHPRGLADNVGTGYVRRPMRLERTSFRPHELGCIAQFEDLGGPYATKPSTLDTITNWSALEPPAGRTLVITNGSAVVVAGAASFSAADVGRHLWTFGASDALNRRSRRITVFTDTTHVTVEFAYTGITETLTATATTGWDAVWRVAETQASKGSAYRPQYIRACKESTGLFRDGTTAGFQVV